MTAWNTYKTKMIVNNGGGLRVQRPENGNDTVSEGIAYGMLMAVYMDDKATFDGAVGVREGAPQRQRADELALRRERRAGGQRRRDRRRRGHGASRW